MDRLDDARRNDFARVWYRLPNHLRDVEFELHHPGWSPEAIDDLADALCDPADVFLQIQS